MRGIISALTAVLELIVEFSGRPGVANACAVQRRGGKGRPQRYSAGLCNNGSIMLNSTDTGAIYF